MREYVLKKSLKSQSDVFRNRPDLDRDLDTLLGLCAGLIADNEVNEQEIHFLNDWLSNHEQITSCFPGDRIASHIKTVLSDGVVSEEEKADTLMLLRKLTGKEEEGIENASSTLPLTHPRPILEIGGNTFCLTGTFAYGTRKACESATAEAGGSCKKNPSGNVNFLVIGSMVTPAWKHESFGRKIEAAIEKGIPIISEEHWASMV